MQCTNCGKTRHIEEQCFELVGYPEWWNNGHKKGTKGLRSEKGKAPNVDNGSNQKTPIGFGGVASAAKIHRGEESPFSMDVDFDTTTKPTKPYIHTANGEKLHVKTRGTFEISPTLKHSKCLHVPDLSHKLLLVIRKGVIIGRGTEKHGLYYMDEVARNGTVLLSHGTAEREAWLWHRRLGHPSTSYLHVLFPNLFSLNLLLCLPPQRSGERENDTLSWLRTASYGEERGKNSKNEDLNKDPQDSAPQETAPNLIPT
ncbi:putative ribonuclease H-like domain-containing protein, partial [Tanacetum coccineum]